MSTSGGATADILYSYHNKLWGEGWFRNNMFLIVDGGHQGNSEKSADQAGRGLRRQQEAIVDPDVFRIARVLCGGRSHYIYDGNEICQHGSGLIR